MFMQNRRSAMLALAAAGCAAPVLITAVKAQTTAPQNADYADYVSQTLMVGGLSLQTSQVAAEKATDPMVREFAMLEVGEQTAIASVLSATETGAQPPALPEDQTAMVNDLNAMEAGAEFDRMYIEAQIDGHNQLLEIQRSIVADTDPTVEVITARLAEQAVMSHLAMLAHIQAMLDQSGEDAGDTAPASGETQPPAAEAPPPAGGEGAGANTTGGEAPAPADGAAPPAAEGTAPAAQPPAPGAGDATGGGTPAAGTTTGG